MVIRSQPSAGCGRDASLQAWSCGTALFPAAGGNAAPASADGDAPASETARLLREVASAAAQAAEVLDGGDTAAALAAMDAICATAAQSRRLLKAAASGRKPRGTTSPAGPPWATARPRPGSSRGLPGCRLHPHAIGRVLSRSSGAVANGPWTGSPPSGRHS